MTVIQENVSETNIYGFEPEASMPLSETLSLNGFLGYTHAEYDDYLDPLTRCSDLRVLSESPEPSA